MPTLITLESFKDAIKSSMKTPPMLEEAAVGLAEHMLNFFGFQDRIIDNMLDPEDRDAFYMLEDVGLLTTEREETGLPDGREWRIHYWLLREDRIMKALKQKSREGSSEKKSKESVYDQIPDDVWFRRDSSEETEPEEEEEDDMEGIDWATPEIPGTLESRVTVQSIVDLNIEKRAGKDEKMVVKKEKAKEEKLEDEEKKELVSKQADNEETGEE